MKTTSGAGRPVSASGVRPSVTVMRCSSPNRAALSRIVAARSARASMALAVAPGAARQNSTEMEPDPAPRSQRWVPGRGASADRVSARTGRLVIWPSWVKRSSGRPEARGSPAAPSASIASTTGWAMSPMSTPAAVVSRIRWRGPPSASNTVRREGPNPCLVSHADRSPTAAPSRRVQRTRTPFARTGVSRANGAACRPRQSTSSIRHPIAAAASEKQDGAGWVM